MKLVILELVEDWEMRSFIYSMVTTLIQKVMHFRSECMEGAVVELQRVKRSNDSEISITTNGTRNEWNGTGFLIMNEV